MGRGGRKPPFFMMSIFSESKTSVASIAVPIFDKQPDPIGEAVASAIVSGDSITGSILEAAITNVGNGIERAYNYAASGKYSLGLPKASGERVITNKSFIEDYLTTQETLPSRVTHFKYDNEQYEFFLKDHLVTAYGYNRLTRRATSLPGDRQEQLDFRKAAYIDTLTDELSGLLPALRAQVPVSRIEENAITYNGAAATEVLAYEITSKDNVIITPTDVRYSVLIDYTMYGLQVRAPYYGIEFASTANITVYNTVSVSYVQKVSRHVRDSNGDMHEPTVALDNAVSFTAETTTRKQTFTESVTTVYTPDIDVVTPYYYVEYYLIHPDGSLEPKHLLYAEGSGTYPEFSSYQVSEGTPYYPVVPLRRDNEDLFDLAREAEPDYITGKALLDTLNIDVVGLSASINESPDIADIDHAYLMFGVDVATTNTGGIRYLSDFFTYAKSFTDVPDTDPLAGESNKSGLAYIQAQYDTDFTMLQFSEGGLKQNISWKTIEIKSIKGSIGHVGFVKSAYGEHIVAGNKVYYLDLHHQMGGNTYKHTRVYGLRLVNFIYESHTNVAETTLANLIEDPDNHNLIIPLHNGVVEALPVFIKTSLYYAAPQLVFYAYEKTKLEWYQTGIFKAILVIVAIAVIIYTGVNIYSALIAAFEVGGYTAAAIYLASYIATSMVISYAFKYAVKVVGEEFAIIAAIAAIIVSAVNGQFEFGFMQGILADNLLWLAANLSAGIAANVKDDMLELQQQSEAFQDEAKDLMDELEQKKELLKTSTLLDPFAFIKIAPLINLNESPDTFFRRTVQNTNVGTMSFEAVDNFAEISLLLPEPTHTGF